MTEEKIDRRAHWAQVIATGLVIATIWCVKIQIELAGVKSDMEIQKARRDEMIARLVEKVSSDHDRIVMQGVEIEWLKSGGHIRNAPNAED